MSNDNDKLIIGPWVHRFSKFSLLCFRFLFVCFVLACFVVVVVVAAVVVVSCAFPPPNHFSQGQT